MITNDLSSARVGDTLWHLSQGEVIVTEVNPREEYPICVNRDGYGKTGNFTFDGRYSRVDVQPLLFWSRPKFDIPAPPKRIVKREGWIGVGGRSTGCSGLHKQIRGCSNIFATKDEIIAWGWEVASRVEWEEAE
jgi:hypothetical protein